MTTRLNEFALSQEKANQTERAVARVGNQLRWIGKPYPQRVCACTALFSHLAVCNSKGLQEKFGSVCMHEARLHYCPSFWLFADWVFSSISWQADPLNMMPRSQSADLLLDMKVPRHAELPGDISFVLH